jgi:hypothetical protein
MTFEQLAAIDPRLRELETYARAQRTDTRNYWTRWEEVKQHLSALVGWHRPVIDQLSTAEAYETVTRHIFRAYAEANGKLAEGAAD